MILVAGATGPVGRALVADLLARGARVRILAGGPEEAAALEAAGAEAVVADLAQPATLARALRRVERLFLAVEPGERQAALAAGACAVAEQSGAYAVVTVGPPTAADPSELGRAHAEALRSLRASSLRWTVLRPAPLLQDHGDGPELPGVHGDARVAHVDARDVAAVAARALTEEGHEGSTYALTGPQALTDAALASALGRTLRPVTPAEQAERRRAAGLDPWTIAALAELDAALRSGAGAAVTDDVPALLGRPATSAADFALAHFAP